MRKFLASLLLFVPILLFAAPAQPDTLRLLCIGNSFTEDAVEQNLHEIAAADGHILIVGNLYIGGCSLEKHWFNAERDFDDYAYRKVGADGVRVKHYNARISTTLSDEPWDVVVFHQQSAQAGQPETFEPWLTNLERYVKARTKRGCKYMLHSTWAYAQDATNEHFPEFDCDQERMYDSIVRTCRAVAKRHRLGLIPSGTAVQNSRHTFNRHARRLPYALVVRALPGRLHLL